METEKQLKLKANSIRKNIILMLTEAGSGHTAGSFGMADVFTTLYFDALNITKENIETEDRDYVILSNGHICPVQYATLAEKGIIGKDELLTLRKLGTKLQGHPHRTTLPGLETTSGPLGSGLSQSVGISLALTHDDKDNKVVCLTSDGEHEEGNHWEAVMLANKYNVSNLIQIVDRNHIQIDGNTPDIMPLESLKDKYESFGWNAREIDGHDISEIRTTLEKAWNEDGPSVLIAQTTPGKGVDMFEDDHGWHGKPPNEDEANEALKQLNKRREEIQNE